MNKETAKIAVRGKIVDDHTSCVHYHSPLDVIAIKFKCCREYYPCYQCHEEEAGHAAEAWQKTEWNNKAILCGMCKNEMTIRQYVESGNQCVYCHTGLNPNCSRHYHLYFEV